MTKKGLSSKDALRAYLTGHVGITLSGAELHAAANGASQWARRLRELRQEEGWKISSHFDRSDLMPEQYVLEEPPPELGAYTFERGVSQKARAQVLERNGYTCQMCGIGAGDTDEYGRKARPHIGHVLAKSLGGPPVPSNLRALCTACNVRSTESYLRTAKMKVVAAKIAPSISAKLRKSVGVVENTT